MNAIFATQLTIALSFAALCALLAVVAYIYIKRGSSKVSIDEQISELLEDDLLEDSLDEVISEGAGKKPNLVFRWNAYWSELTQNAGVGRYAQDASRAGRDMLILFVSAGILTAIVFRQPVLVAIVPAVLALATSSALKMRNNKDEEKLRKQLPGLLFAIKANLQAGDTNERALMKVVDSMPEPLREDLLVAKKILLANGTFKDALEALGEQTTSRDLQFLCACMIQASKSGSSITYQIDNIQEVLKARQQVSNTIAKAVKSVSPSIWVSTLAIPIVFFASLLIDTSAQGYWFKSFTSWVVLAIVLALYVLGIWLSKKKVDKIKNM